MVRCPYQRTRRFGQQSAWRRGNQGFLTQIPMRGSLDAPVPTDPTIYRFYEIVQVYGTTLKALIHEEFGDGIMSAIDFDLIFAAARPKW